MTKTEDEGFLGRWARLKRSRAAEVAEEPKVVEEAAEAEPEPFDLASLPALETLDAVSDYTAFLKPGVPRELRLWLCGGPGRQIRRSQGTRRWPITTGTSTRRAMGRFG